METFSTHKKVPYQSLFKILMSIRIATNEKGSQHQMAQR